MADDGEILIVGTGERFTGPAGVVDVRRRCGPMGSLTAASRSRRRSPQGDRVVVIYRGRGTHTGTLRSSAGEIPATGKEVTLDLCDVVTIHGRQGHVPSARTSTPAPYSPSSV